MNNAEPLRAILSLKGLITARRKAEWKDWSKFTVMAANWAATDGQALLVQYDAMQRALKIALHQMKLEDMLLPECAELGSAIQICQAALAGAGEE